jgi:hypothetical protein
MQSSCFVHETAYHEADHKIAIAGRLETDDNSYAHAQYCKLPFMIEIHLSY